MVLENKTIKPEREETSEVKATDLEKTLAHYKQEETYDNYPVCPFCNTKNTESCDWGFKMDETEEEAECENCGKTYFVIGQITHTFTSFKQKDPETSHETRLKALAIMRKELEEGS